MPGAAADAAATARQEAKLAAENRDLVGKLAATHQKLKQLRARSQQREAVQQAQVRLLAFWLCLSVKMHDAWHPYAEECLIVQDTQSVS